MSPLLIYGLADPRTGAIRYIGKSKTALRRPRAHGGYLLLRDKSPKGDWVRALITSGVNYEIRVLEEVDAVEGLDDAECFWIAQGRGLGWPLTNVRKGGLLGLGMVHSPEARAKISASKKGVLHTPEQREKNRQALLKHHAERPRGAEWRAKLSAAHKGRAPKAATMPRSPEWLANMAAAQRRRFAREREAACPSK